MNADIKEIRTYRDEFHAALIDEIQHEFRDYRHYGVGFDSILKSLTYNISEPVLRDREFRQEIKYELKLILNYLHMVRDRNLIREIKTSLFPMLLLGAAGNITAIKLIMIATYLSAKAMPFICETYAAITARGENQDPDYIAHLYAQMLSDLRHVAARQNIVEHLQEDARRQRKLLQMDKMRLRRKNCLRRRLGLNDLEGIPDDPYRTLPVLKPATEELGGGSVPAPG